MSAWLALAVALAFAPPALAGPERIAGARVAVRAAADPAPVLAALGTSGVEWAAWTVPGVAAVADLCCFGRDWRVRRCSLAGRNSGWGTRDDGAHPDDAAVELLVLVEVARGGARTVLPVGPSCPIDGAGRAVTWLDGVAAEASLALLDGIARVHPARADDEPADAALAALAYHRTPSADRLLAALAADAGLHRERRGQALFWSGQLRGRAGYDLLDRTLAGETDDDLREETLFALSESPVPEARPRLLRAAREDRAPEVRAQALFWLAESAPDPEQAAAWILDAIASDADAEVREQGVFALSQLEGGVAHLVRLLRENRDPELRRQALFWLGQSDDPRALAELEQILAER